jgi:phage gp46-like protein
MQLLVWNQLPDHYRGNGWWINIADEDAFCSRLWIIDRTVALLFAACVLF